MRSLRWLPPLVAAALAAPSVLLGSPYESSRSVSAACAVPNDALWSDAFGLPMLNGSVLAVTVDGSDLVIGGGFSQAGHTPAFGVVRWNGTTFSPMGEGIQKTVRSLAIWNGSVVASGDPNSEDVGRVFQFDGSSWTSIGEFDGRIRALMPFGSDLVATGDFTQADGVSVGCVARWDGVAWHPMGTPTLSGTGFSLAEYQGELILGGSLAEFTSIARWNGVSWSGLGQGLSSTSGSTASTPVHALLSHGGFLYASGLNVNYTGTTAFTGLPRWNGTTWSNLGTSTAVRLSLGLAVFNGDIVATRGWRWSGSSWVSFPGGVNTHGFKPWGTKLVSFGAVGEIPLSLNTSGIDCYDGVTTSTIREAWNPGTMAGWSRGSIAATVWQDQLVVGGFVFGVGAQTHWEGISSAAIWDGSAWNTVGPAGLLGGGVLGMTTWNGALVVGTTEPYMSGVVTRRIAQWDGNSWTGIGEGFNDWVHSVLVHDGQLHAFGLMTLSGSTAVGGAARWTGSAWQPLGSGFNYVWGWPTVAITYEDDIVVGGDFIAAGGTSASRVARWDGSTWQALGGGVDAEVRALTVFEGDLIVGGDFTTAGGTPSPGIARWSGSSWQAMGGSALRVGALRVIGGRLYAAGEFACSGSSVRTVALWNGSDWTLLGSDFGPSASFTFLQDWNDELFVGGSFGWAAGRPSFNIARWSGLSTVSTEPPSPVTSLGLRASVNPSRGPLAFEIHLPQSGTARLALFDVSGRRVVTLLDETRGPGVHRVDWDGCDALGRLCGAGVFLARLETSAGMRSIKVVRTR